MFRDNNDSTVYFQLGLFLSLGYEHLYFSVGTLVTINSGPHLRKGREARCGFQILLIGFREFRGGGWGKSCLRDLRKDRNVALNPRTVFLPLDHWAWDISSTLWKGSFIHYSHFRQHTFHMSLFSYINISAPDRSPCLSFSLPPPGGHFVYVNHTVTLRIPKMASVSIYSTQESFSFFPLWVPWLLLETIMTLKSIK